MRLFPSLRATRRLVMATAVLATACINSDPAKPLVHLKVQDIVVESGGDQTGVEGQPLAQPVVVHALLSDGTNDTSHTIYCTILSGNGAIQVGGDTASGDGAVLPGPGDGTLSVVWTMGTAGVQQKLQFYVTTSETISADALATSISAN